MKLRSIQFFVLIIAFFPTMVFAQSYTTYLTGNTSDIQTNPQGGVCLMGGATENDNAMTWFLNRADGGDVLVLRASGGDGYNDYLYSQLGVMINSVETIVCHNANAANENYIHQKIQQAEAIWFAGGDQWDYITYWQDTPIQTYINEGIQNRNIVIGGTSAGMAIQGEHRFSAENGTITSSEALANPYHPNLTISSTPFIANPYLESVITDTHFDNPDRKGRLMTFMARIEKEIFGNVFGIACDEYTAVCIDENGVAHVYGGYPTYDDNAYFLQRNCESSAAEPELCEPNMPLTWDWGQAAVKVYKIQGTSAGTNTFDLTDRKTGTGGEWQHWYVQDGVFYETSGTPVIDCVLSSPNVWLEHGCITVLPTIVENSFIIAGTTNAYTIEIIDINGQVYQSLNSSSNTIEIDISTLPNGMYFVAIQNNVNVHLCVQKILKI